MLMADPCNLKLKKVIKREDGGDVCSSQCSTGNEVRSDDKVVIIDKPSLITWYVAPNVVALATPA
jgi:hypothetical protein